MNVQRLMAVCSLLLLLLTPGPVAGQTPVPAGDTDPIDFVFTSYPRQIVYLGVDPGASVFVTLLAYDTVIPAGLTPDYSCDVDGDGAFTPWFFRNDCGEKVTMAGPFVATMRVRAAGREPASAALHMQARQFEAAYVDVGQQDWPALAVVAGRPAIAYRDANAGLKFAINASADGSGAWTDTVVDARSGIECPCTLAVVGGHPTIAYADANQETLVVARNARADGSGAWETWELGGEGAFAYPTLTTVDGKPAVSYYHGGAIDLLVNEAADGSGSYRTDGVDGTRYSSEGVPGIRIGVGGGLAGPNATALVGDPPTLTALVAYDNNKAELVYKVQRRAPDKGWTTVRLGDKTRNANFPTLAMLNGRPGIAFRDYLTGRLKIALATTADGQGEWTVQDQDTSLQPKKHLGQSLALIDGRPAVAYTHDTQGVLFAYDSGRPDSGFWPSVAVGREGVAGTGTPSLAQVAGRPAVVYADGAGIRFVRAR